MKRAALATIALLVFLLGGYLLALAGAMFGDSPPTVSTRLFLLLCVCVIALAALFHFRIRAAGGRIRFLSAASAIMAAVSSIYPLSVMAFHFARPELAAVDMIILGVGLMLLAIALVLASLKPAVPDEAAPN